MFSASQSSDPSAVTESRSTTVESSVPRSTLALDNMSLSISIPTVRKEEVQVASSSVPYDPNGTIGTSQTDNHPALIVSVVIPLLCVIGIAVYLAGRHFGLFHRHKDAVDEEKAMRKLAAERVKIQTERMNMLYGSAWQAGSKTLTPTAPVVPILTVPLQAHVAPNRRSAVGQSRQVLQTVPEVATELEDLPPHRQADEPCRAHGGLRPNEPTFPKRGRWDADEPCRTHGGLRPNGPTLPKRGRWDGVKWSDNYIPPHRRGGLCNGVVAAHHSPPPRPPISFAERTSRVLFDDAFHIHQEEMAAEIPQADSAEWAEQTTVHLSFAGKG